MKAGQTLTRLLGKIGAGKKWHLVGREEHRQWPATAAPCEDLVHRLINLIEIRPLLAIHLDADKQAIHHFRHFSILKAFARHDVAPVAG